MSNLVEKLGYIRGMMDGLKLNHDDDTVKLLGMIVDALGDVAASIVELENDQQELNDYVESIDDDLTELEEQHRDDALSGSDDEDDEYDILNDEVPARRQKGKLSVLRADDDRDDEEDDSEEDDEELEDAETNFYIGCVCPACGRFFSVMNPDDYDDDQKFECPFCKKHVTVTSMNLDGIPTAQPVDD